MTIEEKLEERLKAQGWTDCTVNVCPESVITTCCLEEKNNAPVGGPGPWVEKDTGVTYEVRGKLDAEMATEIEAYFKEQLTK